MQRSSHRRRWPLLALKRRARARAHLPPLLPAAGRSAARHRRRLGSFSAQSARAPPNVCCASDVNEGGDGGSGGGGGGAHRQNTRFDLIAPFARRPLALGEAQERERTRARSQPSPSPRSPLQAVYCRCCCCPPPLKLAFFVRSQSRNKPIKRRRRAKRARAQERGRRRYARVTTSCVYSRYHPPSPPPSPIERASACIGAAFRRSLMMTNYKVFRQFARVFLAFFGSAARCAGCRAACRHVNKKAGRLQIALSPSARGRRLRINPRGAKRFLRAHMCARGIRRRHARARDAARRTFSLRVARPLRFAPLCARRRQALATAAFCRLTSLHQNDDHLRGGVFLAYAQMAGFIVEGGAKRPHLLLW